MKFSGFQNEKCQDNGKPCRKNIICDKKCFALLVLNG
jgi:hypothetical protein